MTSITVYKNSYDTIFMPCDFDSELPYESERQIVRQAHLFNEDSAWGNERQCVAVDILDHGVFVTLRDEDGNETREKFMYAVEVQDDDDDGDDD